MNSEKVLKVGIIGVGIHGQGHVRCFQSLHNAEVVALTDINNDRVKDVANRYGVTQAYTDYKEMLDKVELDAVAVVLPDHLHLDASLAVIESGRNLLVEKPLAIRVEDAEAIVKAARDKGVRMMVNFSNRFQVPIQQAREAFVSGELGDPLYAYLRLNNTIYVPTKMLAWSSRTKTPFWLMSHLIDRIRWIWGSDPRRAYGVQRSVVLKGMGVDTPDFYHGTVEFDNGAVAAFESCWILPDTSPMSVDSKMEMIFTKAAMTIDAMQTMVQKATSESFTYPATLTGTVNGHPVGFLLESIRHFVDSILAGRDPEPSGEDGLVVLKTAAAIVESADKGVPVEIK
ncbi:MAG: Gfo/Idh/MocA family oxidoreductase [Planctomycetota bacterium]|nr:Gfo/Idh/MocA family oxidoreductase [Planctomycetota bacterium]